VLPTTNMKKIARHKLGPPRPVQHSQLVDREQRLSDCPIIKPPDQRIEDHAKIRCRQHPIHSSTRYISPNFSSGCTGKSLSQGNHHAPVGTHIAAQVLQS
jgi:hypothetical protein